MFPKNRINIIYRLLCLISYIVVIYMINSFNTLLILLFAYIFFGLCEKSFTHIELIVITIVILGLCYMFDNYVGFKIMLGIDYIYYFLSSTYDTSYEIISKEEYVRFAKTKKKRKKGSNNITAIYLTVHLVILFLAIMVG